MKQWTELVHIYGNEAGARIAFENACSMILTARHPNENVNSVRVHQGDGGIDVYVGYLGVEPVEIYQCKFFIDGVSDTQKDQIRKSFKSANESDKFKISKWVLCLPVDLTVSETVWFDKWAAKQQGVRPSRIPPLELYAWAEDANLANIIFKRKDSLNIEAILALVSGANNSWAIVLEQAESDCFKILFQLSRKHFSALGGEHRELEKHVQRAEAGDRMAICEYIKSVLVGPYPENIKIWLLNFMSDFTLEPVIYRFLRRYAILVRLAREQGHFESLSTSEYFSTFMLVLSPVFERLRRVAEWSKENEDNIISLSQPSTPAPAPAPAPTPLRQRFGLAMTMISRWRTRRR